MFQRLNDLSYQRSLVQAIGFYLVYGILGVLLAAIAGGIAGVASGSGDYTAAYQAGATVGPYVAVVFELVLAFLVLLRKGQLSNPIYLILVLVGVIVSFLAGVVGGNIIVAFLSTRAPQSSAVVPVQGQ